ncbi:hypothetical protein FA95DRAFT_1557066 [Auriscalpium vulgare]|uniref:Uncharacterized protein n=1 Tax=Auriscalpium vulgare TaxID=40419 RepID=A0ACB8RYV3_9AGAM|nr:hypothetical protein FA95DRAFT_1557066 [Auriscalpium vulgare]
MSSPEHVQPADRPPAPFADFEFAFDPSLNSLFPPPPPLPSSAGLFSASETTDLFGFLDNFNWEFDPEAAPNDAQQTSPSYEPSSSSTSTPSAPAYSPTKEGPSPSVASMTGPKRTSPRHLPPLDPSPSSPPLHGALRTKPLLSSPQKRLNHIMSEQKRRNAIREGYAQLTTLLAPAGANPGALMPTRGRPKGSGSRGKGKTKGKSGVLFRAVEYCCWLEEGIDALRDEVLRVEAAAGIRSN